MLSNDPEYISKEIVLKRQAVDLLEQCFVEGYIVCSPEIKRKITIWHHNLAKYNKAIAKDIEKIQCGK